MHHWKIRPIYPGCRGTTALTYKTICKVNSRITAKQTIFRLYLSRVCDIMGNTRHVIWTENLTSVTFYYNFFLVPHFELLQNIAGMIIVTCKKNCYLSEILAQQVVIQFKLFLQDIEGEIFPDIMMLQFILNIHLGVLGLWNWVLTRNFASDRVFCHKICHII